MSTILIPIQPEAGPSRVASTKKSLDSSFAQQASGAEDEPDLETVIRRVRNARRIVVVAGAGISTAASIPDFRGASGLFSGSKGHNVKDLFDFKSTKTPALLAKHHALLTELYDKASKASPTHFHNLLASLNDDGRLLRCYTQNIDGLEERAGLPTGVPSVSTPARRVAKGKGRAASLSAATSGQQTPDGEVSSSGSALGDISAALNPGPPSHPPAPRCIPLHGILTHMHCSLCSAQVPIEKCMPLPPHAIPCPECELASSIRSALNERSRPVGALRASVVLYSEHHPDGEGIGAVTVRDLKGTGRRGEREGQADLLIVAGTSLAIKGVKKMIKEMSEMLATRPDSSVSDGKSVPVRTIYLNNEPPTAPGSWGDVFDVWCKGDIQQFADLVADDKFAPPLPITPRKPTPRKRVESGDLPPTPNSSTPSKPRKRKADNVFVDIETTPTKKSKKPVLPLTPGATPPRARPASNLRESSPSPEPKAKRERAVSPTPEPKSLSSDSSRTSSRDSTLTPPPPANSFSPVTTTLPLYPTDPFANHAGPQPASKFWATVL
ncbi:NAD-dependent protein deacetylase hst4 [Vanrija pseudolonga]|uniref:NAD-dependent protein deacetylase hst4 n=1 Tax=Vanrija pseudolonga TaxID=143232 RepID=A0AAF0YFC5_9TREE|nr:NAD-dependent protein deacetylase hst4 [Vanrija pseudolonga]